MTSCSLRLQVDAINKLAAAGMYFWDYGNAFLLEASRAGNGILYIITMMVGACQVLKLPSLEELSFTHPMYKT